MHERLRHDPAPSDAIATSLRRVARDAELSRQGWSRRFIGGPPKLREHVELYESLGHEVLLDPISRDELAEACAGCALALRLFKVVYTRGSQ